MSFPPRFIDELRNRVSLPTLIGRRVRLVKRGREWTGLCPFHNEKSPSFTVNEDKGFFHCFGCGAHGDAFEYLRRAEGLSFVEAVERLAGEAGMALPAPDPQQREHADRLTVLQDVLEVAADWYQAQLAAAVGARARHYLEERGLSRDTIARFRLGFAPDSRGMLKQALLGRGIAERLLVESGMLIEPTEGGGASYDRFRDRMMFPITDRRGRVIAFGGRAFGDIKPKYLNSPDTPLFHKGRVLFNLALARPAAQSAEALVVTEGYMDVIAMAQAGFGHAVAPLGTALTEDQLELLWRLVPEPLLCFDGDAAGQRAAIRAAERALPLLKPGRSLRFALLPAGEDPDSLLRHAGAPALQAVLDRAEPLVELLWRKLVEGRPLDTPERRAALQQALGEAAGRIADEVVRGYYRQWFRQRLATVFSQRPAVSGDRRRLAAGDARHNEGWRARAAERGADRSGGGFFARRGGFEAPASAELRARAAARPQEGRERLLLVILLNHPVLIERVAEDLAVLEITSPELDSVRRAILDGAVRNPGLDSAGLQRHLNAQGFAGILTRLVGPEASGLHWFARPEAALPDVEAGWDYVLRRHRRAVGLQAELRLAEAELAQEMTEERFAKLVALQREIAAGQGDEAELEHFGIAPDRATTS